MTYHLSTLSVECRTYKSGEASVRDGAAICGGAIRSSTITEATGLPD